jgi:hypothetical protein
MILESKYVNGSISVDLNTFFDSMIMKKGQEMSEIQSKYCSTGLGDLWIGIHGLVLPWSGSVRFFPDLAEPQTGL